MASAMFFASNFFKICFLCASIVLVLMKSSNAMVFDDFPLAINCKTSNSRTDSFGSFVITAGCVFSFRMGIIVGVYKSHDLNSG